MRRLAIGLMLLSTLVACGDDDSTDDVNRAPTKTTVVPHGDEPQPDGAPTPTPDPAAPAEE